MESAQPQPAQQLPLVVAQLADHGLEYIGPV